MKLDILNIEEFVKVSATDMLHLKSKLTGEEVDIYSTGGGTYARKLGGRGVAFGPNFKGDDIRMHNADESVDYNNFFKHAQICLEAIYRLYTL